MGTFSATTEGEEALAAATAETLLHLIGSANTKAKLIEWGVSFDSTSPTAEPVQVKLFRTTADDGTASAATEQQWGDADGPTINCSVKHSFTVEPTKASLPIFAMNVHPQAGLIIQYPLGREPGLDNSASAGICIEVTAPAAVNAHAYMVWEE